MSGFDDRNRYSYSGADARAYAFYPAKTLKKTLAILDLEKFSRK